ncbi:class I SAM-dependent methyltransferase [Flavobacterium sp. NRK F10]|uniref:class I SAM-dependent methyltransferase n=1 Tax=Flavobacterium sp. NRK F10 TaxID=2954931 RepID=UPI002091302E|nr:class I SAM-dependent methyltransferase [Flavobacterium sp. NRK F10]MCO6175114.1 class I SAM-dependent methyltransferase [Flavobacterium sp. NRK F10]
MKASFDVEAIHYDSHFTYTSIGKAQRAMVYHHLQKHLTNPLTILEINCGTGEDAIWLARQHHTVCATDISEKMIEVAKEKGSHPGLSFIQADIRAVSNHFNAKDFDLVFSNFGGLNCLSPDEMDRFLKTTDTVLSANGKLILTLMPEGTLWEKLYFLLKGQFSKISRRKTAAVATLGEEKVITYYYNPKEIVNLSKDKFNTIEVKPIGFFIPPSYLEPFLKNKKLFFKVLTRLDSLFKNLSFLAKYSDHYLIVLEKK